MISVSGEKVNFEISSSSEWVNECVRLFEMLRRLSSTADFVRDIFRLIRSNIVTKSEIWTVRRKSTGELSSRGTKMG